MQNRRQMLAGMAAAVCGLLAAWPQDRPNAVPPEERVDINHASIDELLKVPGMTRTWAGRIVRFRPYHGKNDLVERGVVSSAVYERIKDYIIAHREAR